MKRLGGTTSGALANLAAQGVPFLLLLFVTPVLLRTLGREAYGALVLFNLVPQIAGQLDLGLATAGTRGYAQFRASSDLVRARQLFVEVCILLGLWALVLAGSFYLFREYIAGALKLDSVVPDRQPLAYLAASFNIVAALLNAGMLIPLRALERYQTIARVQVIGGVAYWSICAVLAHRGATVGQLVTLGTVVVALTTLALYRETRRLSSLVDIDASKLLLTEPQAPEAKGNAITRKLLITGFIPLGIGSFVAQASSLSTYHADKLLISSLISPASAGAYAICTNIANKVLMVIASAATFTFPRATQLHTSGDSEGLAATYIRATRVCATLAMCGAVPVIGLAHPFLSLWLGDSFANQYVWVLRLLTIGYVITAFSVVAANVAVGMGDSRMPATFAFMGGLVTIIALLILTPRFGLVGAAFGSLIGMSQSIVFNSLIARRLGSVAWTASWPLVIRLATVGVPTTALISYIALTVQSWTVLFAIAAFASCIFPLLWFSTFGRNEEWPIFKTLILRAMYGN